MARLATHSHDGDPTHEWSRRANRPATCRGARLIHRARPHQYEHSPDSESLPCPLAASPREQDPPQLANQHQEIATVAFESQKDGLFPADSTALLLDTSMTFCASGRSGGLGCLPSRILDLDKRPGFNIDGWPELRRAFEERNRAAHRLVRSYGAVPLAPATDIQRLFKQGRFYHIRRRYPGVRHLVQLSAPAYTADQTKALIYIQSICDGRCGGGALLLLDKTRIGWVVARTLTSLQG